MPCAIGANGKDSSLEPWMSKVNENRHRSIQALWYQYQEGRLDVDSPLSPPSPLQVISGDRLLIKAVRDGPSKTITAIEVQDLGAEDGKGVNYMGYHQTSRCFAFRGEARHLDEFLDLAPGLIKDSQIEAVFKSPAEVRIPKEGLEYGLRYEEFAGRVEIVEYAMWLKASEDIHTADDTITIISVMKDGVQVVLEDEESDSHKEPRELPIEGICSAPKPCDNTVESNMMDLDSHPTAPVSAALPDQKGFETPGNELSLVPNPIEGDLVQQQMDADAKMALALATETPTRYSLRTRANTIENSPAKAIPRITVPKPEALIQSPDKKLAKSIAEGMKQAVAQTRHFK